MIALQIDVDGKRYVTAGVDDWSLLNAIVNLSRAEPRSKVRDGYMEVTIGAYTTPNADGVRHHVRWPDSPLKVGSVVTISIIETETPDPPRKRYRSDSEVQENSFTDEEWQEMKYRDYLELKEEFEGKSGG